MGTIALLGLPAIPLLSVMALWVPRWRRLGMQLAPLAAAPALLLAALGPVTQRKVPWLTLDATLGLDRVGRTFLFLTGLIWLLAGISARCSLAADPHKTRFFTLFLLAMAGNLGLIIALDMLSFYLCFAVMSFATYGLVVHRGHSADRQAGRVYLGFAVIGEMALFAAFLLGNLAASSLEFAQVRGAIAGHPQRDLFMAAALLGFGIKSGLIALHIWMPLAYRASPDPAAAALSGAMFAAGLYGWLRLLPMGETALPAWGEVLVTAGLAATFLGVITGLAQRHPKSLLAYSSISQMGLMTAGLGVALAEPQAWPLLLPALVVFSLHHSLAKAALFLGLGVARAASTDQRRWVGAGLLLPALALAGLPGTSGLLAKELLKNGALADGAWGELLYAALPWSSLATTLLVSRFLWLSWPRPTASAQGAARGVWLPWSLLLLAVAAAAWWVPWVQVEGLWSGETLLGGVWPVALGAATAAPVAWLSHRGLIRLPFSVPPGDLLVPLAFATKLLLRGADHLGNQWLPERRERLLALIHSVRQRFDQDRVILRLESRIARWRIGIGAYLLLAITLAAMMLGLQ